MKVGGIRAPGQSSRRGVPGARSKHRWPLPMMGLLVGILAPVLSKADSPLMPKVGQDHTALRSDSEVFGWSRDYQEMVAMALEVQRFPNGKQRGEFSLLVFNVGETIPRDNVHIGFHSQAAMPMDPLPIPDIFSRLWFVDVQYQRMWPRRPKRKAFRGAMKITPLWDYVEVEPGICQPWVGFVLKHRGARRYTPHVPIRLRASCALLQMTDYRVYWAKKDLGAAMIRFDYSSSPRHEKSLRYPLNVSWKLAKAVPIILRTSQKRESAATVALMKHLSAYGAVQLEASVRLPGDRISGITIDHGGAYPRLWERLIKDLEGRSGLQLPSPNTQQMIVYAGESFPSLRSEYRPKGQGYRGRGEERTDPPPLSPQEIEQQRQDALDAGLDL